MIKLSISKVRLPLVSVSSRTFRVMHLVACKDSLYLQESAQLHFTHTQREVRLTLSRVSKQFWRFAYRFQLLC